MYSEINFRQKKQGHVIGKNMPKQIQQAVRSMLVKHKDGRYGAKFKNILEGYDLGLKDRAYFARLLELSRIKEQENKGIEKGR